MKSFFPEVNSAREFSEISRDFTNPLEILREAIHNALDAKANKITISVQMVDDLEFEETMEIVIRDNGKGMDIDGVKSFFNLGYSTKERDEETIGYKGHGTKIFYDSRLIRVRTKTSNVNKVLIAEMKSAKASLKQNKLPPISYEEVDDDKFEVGTEITVLGYNSDENIHFSTREINDYILWFTKLGSPEMLLFPDRKPRWSRCAVRLRGVDQKDYIVLTPGHLFPEECFTNNDFKTKGIKESEKVKYFTKYFRFQKVPLKGRSDVFLDIFISVEGDWARRKSNEWIRYQGRRDGQGLYTVSERYGIYVCKDFIPIQRVNDWVFQTNEWTRFHGFINCQKFDLTANRGSIENTKKDLLPKIKETVKNIIEEQILESAEYQTLTDMLQELKSYKKAENEQSDFIRRRDRVRSQRIAKLSDGTILIEPKQEQGVFALFTTVVAKEPNLFDFKVVDYDTRQGYDAIIAVNTSLDLSRANYRFIEFKHRLSKEINHSFSSLFAIICWDLPEDFHEDTEIIDLTGNKRLLKIVSSDNDVRYMLDSPGEPLKIEIFVLKEFLTRKLSLEWVKRQSL